MRKVFACIPVEHVEAHEPKSRQTEFVLLHTWANNFSLQREVTALVKGLENTRRASYSPPVCVVAFSDAEVPAVHLEAFIEGHSA
jgi:hypothetical protein